MKTESNSAAVRNRFSGAMKYCQQREGEELDTGTPVETIGFSGLLKVRCLSVLQIPKEEQTLHFLHLKDFTRKQRWKDISKYKLIHLKHKVLREVSTQWNRHMTCYKTVQLKLM